MSSTKSPALRALHEAFPYTLPIFAGFWFLAFAYGFYMHTLGFNFLYPTLMAMVIFGGSLEFVTVSMLISPFAPWQAFIVALTVQARHLFYGLSMLEKYKGSGWKKPFILKPSVGFFSLGVYTITSDDDWTAAVADIERNLRESRDRFPESVVDQSSFLVEEYITGEEFAVDVYFDGEGEPEQIVADRGLHGRIDAAQWRQVCEDFGRRRREGDLEAAVLAAIATLSEMLAEHFPADPDAPRDNELPDRPQLLG